MANNEFNLGKEQYQQIMNNLPVAVFAVNYKSINKMIKFTFLNTPAIEFILKIIDPQDLLSPLPLDLVKRYIDLPNTQKFYKKLQEEKELNITKRKFLFTTKGKIQLLIEASLRFILENNTISINGIFQEVMDITNFKDSFALNKNNSAFDDSQSINEFFKTYDSIIMIINEEGNIEFISPETDEIKSSIIGKPYTKIFPKGQADFFLSHIEKAVKDNNLIDIQYHLPIGNEVRWFQSQTIPMKIRNGEAKQVVAIIRDITDRIKKPLDD